MLQTMTTMLLRERDISHKSHTQITDLECKTQFK